MSAERIGVALSAHRHLTYKNAALCTNGRFDGLHRSMFIGWPRSAKGRPQLSKFLRVRNAAGRHLAKTGSNRDFAALSMNVRSHPHASFY
jgi:hypothetical protein